MSKKLDFILHSMIKAYLNEQNPIGSMLLQDSLNMPASTIRVYFKQLGNDGYVSKLHASGGRIPTFKAMKQYWEKYFRNANKFKLNLKSEFELLSVVNSNDVFCMIIDKEKVFLNDIIAIPKKYLILDFVNSQIILKHNEDLENLFKQLKGYEISDIKTILYRLNLLEILKEIYKMQDDKIAFSTGDRVLANAIKLSSFSSILGVKLLDYFSDSLVFDELFLPDYMGIRLACDYEQKNSEIVLIGNIFKNYEEIIEQLKEVA